MPDQYDYFKSNIRNKLRKFNREDLSKTIMKSLYSSTQEKLNPNNLYPWELCALLKWVMKYGDLDKTRTKIITQEQLASLFHSTREFNTLTDNTEGISSFKWYIKKIIHQQSIYSVDYNVALKISLSRDNIIYNKDPSISVKFKAKFGYEIDSILLLILSLFTNSKNVQAAHSISASQFKIMSAFFDSNFFNTVLNSISTTNAQRDEIWGNEKRYNPYFDFFNPSPFHQYPLLNDENGKYPCFSLALLYNRFSNLPYSIMAEDDKCFPVIYGNLFENYIEHIFSFYNVTLDKIPRSNSELRCDYRVDTNKKRILLEVKSFKLSRVAKYSTSVQELLESLESSLVKGLRQILNTANSSTDHCNYIGLIITNEETFLDFVFQDSKDEEILQIFNEYNNVITPDKIFVISIYSLEKLLDISSKSDMDEVIDNIIEKHADVSTQRLSFSQYVREISTRIPQILNSSMEDLMAKLNKHFKFDDKHK